MFLRQTDVKSKRERVVNSSSSSVSYDLGLYPWKTVFIWWSDTTSGDLTLHVPLYMKIEFSRIKTREIMLSNWILDVHWVSIDLRTCEEGNPLPPDTIEGNLHPPKHWRNRSKTRGRNSVTVEGERRKTLWRKLLGFGSTSFRLRDSGGTTSQYVCEVNGQGRKFYGELQRSVYLLW